MTAILKALRAKRTGQIVAAVHAVLAAAVLFGAPLTAQQLAAVDVAIAAVLYVVAGQPKPGEDGDPETPL